MSVRINYVGWGGVTREVEATMHLGHGVMRHDHTPGLRRAVWDAAMGYVSGFRKRDIAYFLLTRSLSRHVRDWALDRELRLGLYTPQTREVQVPDALDGCDDVQIVGFVAVQCPACDVQVNVPVLAGLRDATDEKTERAGQEIITAPELADLWAHIWTHDTDPKEEQT